ncbi:MAG TPA: DUF5947 family protein [Candidatus Acidoferrales bacterium]|nr:DUF5947 family protein [Candidatus Acidoferrales bacterium]
MNAFGSLQRFVRRTGSGERCELCGAGVAAEHEHLIEPDKRRLVCVCQACAILFGGQSGHLGSVTGRYKRVPSRIRFLRGFRLTDAHWDSLLVPINMAFFFASSASGSASSKMIAVYPSPAGATESLLPLETWDQIAAENPELQTMEADVEALLVNRLGAGRGFPVNQYFLLPIDQCFKLVGLVRTNWRGLSGGTELWWELERFFAALNARAGSAAGQHHA